MLISIHLGASAYDFMVDGLCYNKKSDGKSVSLTYEKSNNPANYSSLSGNLIIPTSVTYSGKTYSVTSIESNTFMYCEGLTSITIPNSVTSISDYAFRECFNLSSVSISNSVAYVGNYIFFKCNNLTSIVVESGNSVYDSRENCNAIIKTATNTLVSGCKNTIIPNSVTSIGDFAFCGCEDLTSIKIPNSVINIGERAFSSCRSLTSLTIPYPIRKNQESGCIAIGKNAFSNCDSLKDVYWNAATCIENYIDNGTTYLVFGGSTKLKNIYFGDSVKVVPKKLCYNQTELNNVLISNSVTLIDDNAFDNCDSLTSIIIPNSMTSIGNSAFSSCSSLSSLTIPNTVDLGMYAFSGCGSLKTLTLTGNGAWNYVNTQTGIPITQLKTINIGSGINSLSDSGFKPTVINCYAEIPPIISSGTFSNYNGALHVPPASTGAYFTAAYWQNFNNLINDLVDKVIISETYATIKQEHSLSLNAMTSPEGGSILWSTSNPQVATVSPEGLVTAVRVGECDIFATLDSNYAVYSSCHVNVTPPDTIITLNKENAIIGVNHLLTILPTCSPNVPIELVVTSSDPSVAAVRLVERTNAPLCVSKESPLKQDVLSQVENLTVCCDNKSPALASNMAIMIVGIQYGTATITVTTADGHSNIAKIELRVVDVNGDGVVSAVDVTSIYNYLLDGDCSFIETSDCDGDGYINAVDLTIIYNILLGNEF